MQLGRVTGTLVSSRKEPLMEGMKFLVVRQIDADGTDTNTYVVAVDAVGAEHAAQVGVAGDDAVIGAADDLDVVNHEAVVVQQPANGQIAVLAGVGGQIV